MTDTLTIGLIQREITPHDPAGNLLATLEMLTKCAEQEVDLLVLTELWATGMIDPTDPSSLELAENVEGPTVDALRDFCRESGAYLLAGTLAVRERDRLTNTSLLIDPSGEIILKYSKIHLYRPMGEDAVYRPGERLCAAEVHGVGVGVIICYDLRFPWPTRRLALAGCEVVLVPAMWPEARIKHWEVLLRARAMENQVFMVGANGLLNQQGIFVPGHSMIVGPNGEALNSAEMRETAVVRKLDLRQLRKLRADLCFLDEEREPTDVEWSARVNKPGG